MRSDIHCALQTCPLRSHSVASFSESRVAFARHNSPQLQKLVAVRGSRTRHNFPGETFQERTIMMVKPPTLIAKKYQIRKRDFFITRVDGNHAPALQHVQTNAAKTRPAGHDKISLALLKWG